MVCCSEVVLAQDNFTLKPGLAMTQRWIAVGVGFAFVIGVAPYLAADGGAAKDATRVAQQPATPATQPATANNKHEPGKIADLQPRDPRADPKLIDLSRYYTLGLSEDASGALGYTLDLLPRGVQQLGKTQYDLRGIVQVSSREFVAIKKDFPASVRGIKVGVTCRTLSFLHASRWTDDEGAQIGTYLIHYANGQIREMPIRFGIELRDWKPQHDPGANAIGPPIAWRAADRHGAETMLFETEWTNPIPDVRIATIDMVSTMADAAPFLVAVTAQ